MQVRGHILSDGKKHAVDDQWSKIDSEVILYKDLEKAKRLAGFSSGSNKKNNNADFIYIYLLEGKAEIFDQYDECMITKFSSQLKIVGYSLFTKKEIEEAISKKHTSYNMSSQKNYTIAKLINFFIKGK